LRRSPPVAAQVLEVAAAPVTASPPLLSSLPAKFCVTRAEAVTRAAALPRPRVFTNGVFDLLYRGHVECLQQARALGAR
jgi:bifunctional ADP-heptose synthase (sugar kinase/adenylyltransferase)